MARVTVTLEDQVIEKKQTVIVSIHVVSDEAMDAAAPPSAWFAVLMNHMLKTPELLEAASKSFEEASGMSVPVDLKAYIKPDDGELT